MQCATYINVGATFNQTFTYDGVNRLQTANESIGGANNQCQITGGAASWSRSFGYDAFGNMTPSGNPAPPTVAFNTNNQIATQTYDQAGNLLTVNGNVLSYDYDNMVATETDGISQAVETYVYDGQGHRVEKYGPNGTPKTVFVYDALGQLTAEYSTAVNTSPCATCYLSADYLGTPRLVTDGAGNLIGRHDYLPFGEEVQAGTFGRNGQWGPGNDVVGQKFTGKERDAESGLDYFGARYYGSALGRFTSPDKPLIGQNERNPQSWNLYTYVGNNPLARIDPNGESWRVCVDNGNGGQSCRTLNDDEYQSLYNQQNGQQGINLPSGLAGNITCGGSVCGSAVYHEDSLQDESASIGVGIVAGGIVSKAIGGVAGWVAGLFTKTAAETGTTVASRIILTGFSNAEKAMIQKSLTALEVAGYNTGRLKELIKADFGSRMAGMSLGEDGAALANEAFDSPAMLNHVLEEELLHTEQAARGLSAGNGPGAADALEKEVDSMRKFPDPRNQ